jgi:flagellar basal body rod protein FlgB
MIIWRVQKVKREIRNVLINSISDRNTVKMEKQCIKNSQIKYLYKYVGR